MLTHYLELLIHFRRSIIAFIAIVSLVVLLMAIYMRITSPTYTASAIVSMSPTKLELAYTNAWAQQNFGSPAEISTQTVIEHMRSTPVMAIALKKIEERMTETPESPATASLVDELTGLLKKGVGSIRRIYVTLDRGSFVEPSEQESMLNDLKNSADFETVLGTFLLKINVSHERPVFAAIAANALAEAYVERASAIAAAAADARRSALEAEVSRLEKDLAALDNERPRVLHDRGPQGAVALDRQIQRVEEDLGTTRKRLLSVDLEAANLTADIRVIEPAEVPDYPDAPRLVVYFLAAIFGSALMASFGVLGADFIGNKVLTSFDLKRAVKGQYLGTSTEQPRSKTIPLLNRMPLFAKRTEPSLQLSRSASIKGLLDARIIYLVGFLSKRDSEIVATELSAALSQAYKLRKVSGRQIDNADKERSAAEHKTDPPGAKLVILPSLSNGFQWSDLAREDHGFVVFCLPSGAASYDDLDELMMESRHATTLTPLFFFLKERHNDLAGSASASS